jgi:DNA modification methylase
MRSRTTQKPQQQKSRSQKAAPQKEKKADYAYIAEDLRPLAEPLAKLKIDPQAPRQHDEKNILAIVASLQEFGQRKPIVVNRCGSQIEAGNAVYEAAKRLGWEFVAVVWVTDDPNSASGYAIADNRTAELATWDAAVLSSLLAELGDKKPDLYAGLLLNNLREEILSQLDGIAPGLTDPDEVPEPPDEANTRPGDIWILGNHRLLCGDSSKPEDVDRLLAGAKIQIVNTDPPYNVKVEPRSNNAIAAGGKGLPAVHHQRFDAARDPSKCQPTNKKLRAKDRPLANDFLKEEDFEKLLSAWFGNIARVLEPGRGFYIWGGYANCANYPRPLKESGLFFSQTVIWHKQHPVLTRKDFMGDHEWCFYGWREGAAHKFYGPNNITDVWCVKKVSSQNMVHLTEKPVELAIRAMQYSTHPGENVLDLFGGSGSTLIAAEQTGRNAFLVEIDTLYCDVIVERWQKFTGKKAVREKK